MIGMHLSVDPSGLWSRPQVKRVLEIINPEAEKHGIRFEPIDVTTFEMEASRFMLVATCIKHNVRVGKDEACYMCQEEFS